MGGLSRKGEGDPIVRKVPNKSESSYRTASSREKKLKGDEGRNCRAAKGFHRPIGEGGATESRSTIWLSDKEGDRREKAGTEGEKASLG